MASGTRLVITCKCTDDKEHTFGFAYAKSEPTDSQLATLITALIANGQIYNYVPVTATGAKTVITTENHFVID